MERRSFLKNLFGAAVIATMPKIVVEQIEKAPPEVLTPKIDPVNGVKPVFFKPKDVLQGNCIYLFDENKLIAGSTQFNFNMDRPTISNFSVDDPMIAFTYSTPMSWRIGIDKLRWFAHSTGMDYFTGYKPLRFIAKFNDVKITGEALLVKCTMTIPMFDFIEEDVVLQGIGAIVIETNVDPNKQLLVAETGFSKVKLKKNENKNKLNKSRNSGRLTDGRK